MFVFSDFQLQLGRGLEKSRYHSLLNLFPRHRGELFARGVGSVRIKGAPMRAPTQ